MNIRNLNSLCRKVQANEKAPCEQRWGSKTAPLLAKGAIPAAREGSLAYGFSADHSGGTPAAFHGPPPRPCLQKKKRRGCRAKDKANCKHRAHCIGREIKQFFSLAFVFSPTA